MKSTICRGVGVIAVAMVSTMVSAQWNVLPQQQQPVRVQQHGGMHGYPPPQPVNNTRAVPAFPYGQNRYVPPAQPQPQPRPQYVVPNPQQGWYPQTQYVVPNQPQVYRQPQYVVPDRSWGHRQQSWSYDSYGADPYSGHYEMPDNRRHETRRDHESPRYPKHSMVVGEYSAGGEAKEVLVNRVISRCYLELVSGTVSINTVVVRPEKTKLPQTVRLTPGQLHMIDLGSKRAVTGFRISDGGRGVYRVIVQ